MPDEITFNMPRTFIVPRVPNFILTPGSSEKVSIGDLSDEQLDAIADAWRDRLRERAHEIRNQPKEG